VVQVLPTNHDNHMHVRLPLVARTPPRPCVRRFVNDALGHSLRLPCGWHARVSGTSGTTEISSAPLRGSFGRPAFRAPARGARLWLYDYGRPRRQRVPARAARLSQPSSVEGFGVAQTAVFGREDHVFQAWVKVGRRAPLGTRARVEQLLRSVRLTPRGRLLALRITSRVAARTPAGRPLRVWRVGNPRGGPRVLVVGCIHGDECAGTAVTQRLVNGVRPLRGEIWVVQHLNPDGFARRSRWNARSVDLNRNFPAAWRRTGRSGARPFSEPEARVARDLARRARPSVTIWFHQAQNVVRAWGRSSPAARRYARAVGLPYRSLPWVSGSAPQWQNRRLRQVSFVVELPHGELSAAAADRHARAILQLVR
jgi:protein MpaA